MKFNRTLAFGLLAALALPTAVLPVANAAPPADNSSSDQPDSRRISVIVMLKNQPGTPSESTEAANVASQDDLIAQWGPKYDLEAGRQFGFLVNGFAATIPANRLLALANEPQVESVKQERVYYPNEYNARDMHGVPAAYADYGVDGTGMVVSIIDSGIDMSHQDMRLDDGVCEQSKLVPAEGFTCKVPNGFNYADENHQVKDTTTSMHGQHVAGIVAANGSPGDTPVDPLESGRFDGVAPNAQLLAMKVFSNNDDSGAYDSDIIAAIEDSYKLGADVINMSLGSPNGQKNASDGSYRAIEKAREHGVLAVVSAGNDGLNNSPTGVEDDLFGLWDDATVGAPGTQGSAFTVASIDNNLQLIPVASYNDGTEHKIQYLNQIGEADGVDYEIVDVGLSRVEDYPEGTDLTGKYALVERGENTFTDKFTNAVNHGAEGVIVFNSETGGNDYVNMGGIEEFEVFGASIYRADGLAIREALTNGPVTVRFTQDNEISDYSEGYRPSDFTSWGPTPTLDFEPEISGIGGSVYSTLNDNKYGTMSGTSMAAPNIAGLSALLMQDYKERFPTLTGPELLDRVTTVLMNTALIPTNTEGVPYAPRQIGAGLAQIDDALDTDVVATVDGDSSVALREVNGTRSFTVTLTNYGSSDASYTIGSQKVVNETNNAGETTTTYVSDETLTPNRREVVVPAGGSATVDFTLVPDTSYDHYIEGWATLTGNGVPDLSIPYLGFVGDWNAEPIVKPAGEAWDWDYNTSYTSLVTSWAGMTLPLDVIGIPFWLSPNGDGDIDTVNPSLLLMRNAAEAKYEVFDADGNLVRAIGSEQGLTRRIAGFHISEGYETTHVGTSYGFDGTVWDPQVGDFVAVPDGQYVYKVSTRLGEGFDWQTLELPFGVDGTAPEFVFGELEGDSFTFEIIEEGSGLMDLPTVTTADGTDLEVTDNGDGTYTVTIPEGTPYVTASVLDYGFSLGVGTKVFAPSTLVVASADSLNANVLGPNSQVVNGSTLTLSGYTSSDIVSVTINGVETDVTNGRFTDWVDLVEGENEIVVIGYNAAGEEVDRVVINPVYDSQPPVVELTNTNADGTLSLADDGSVTVTGQITDSREGADLSVTINGEAVEVAADGTFTYTFTPADDIATVTVTGSDGTNTSSTVALIEGREDLVETPWGAPQFTNVQCLYGFMACFVPTDRVDMIDENTFNLKGVIDSPVSTFTLTPASYVDEATGQYVHPDPIVITPNAEGYFEVPIDLTTGMNDFRIYIEDADGNVMVDESTKFYFDITAPTITFDEPTLKGGTLFTNLDEVTFAGTASDDGWGYELVLNDSSIEEVYYNSGFGPESNERSFNTVVAVQDGDEILIVFNDANGNVLLGVIPVVVDKIAPEIAYSIENDTLIENAEPVVTNVTDEHLASVQVSLNSEVIDTHATDLQLTEAPVEDSLIDSRLVDEEPAVDGEQTEGSADATAEGDPVDGELTADQNPDVEVATTGTLATVTEQNYTHTLDTADLAAGQYTLTTLATDLAGNQSTESVTFRIDDIPVIEGADAIDLAIDHELLGNQAELANQVLAQYSVVDDGTWNGGEDATLSLAPGTVLVDGENTVTIVATDINGQRTTREVTVTITLNERTLEDNGVSATGTFRSDDTLTVTITGEDPQVVSVTNEYGTIPATITIPGAENAVIYRVIGDDQRIPVAATWADGVWTFEGLSKGVYLVTIPEEPGTKDPGLPLEPDNPIEQLPIVDDPATGDPESGKPGEDSATPGADAPGAGPSKPLAKTGADVVELLALSTLMTALGLVAVMARRRRS